MLSDGCLAVVIGDVCDKGVGSALIMALIRSLIRVFTGKILSLYPNHGSANRQTAPDVDAVLEAVALTSEYIAQEHGDQGMFATLFLGVIHPATGRLAYINAGHLPLLVIGISGERLLLHAAGASLGIASGLQIRFHCRTGVLFCQIVVSFLFQQT